MTHAHFWLKRQEIEKQCEEWIAEMEKQVESDPNGARAVAAGLTALKVRCRSFINHYTLSTIPELRCVLYSLYFYSDITVN